MSLPVVQNFEKIDENMIDFASKRHRVAPLLYRAHQLDSNANTDGAVRKRLSSLYQKNIVQQLRQKAAAKGFRDLLSNNNIPCLFMKGYHLGDQIYDRPGLRHASDIDALIRPSDARAALSILHDAGYEFIGASNKLRPLRDSWKMRIHKDISFIDTQHGQKMELHLRLNYLEPQGFTEKIVDFTEEVEALPISNSGYVLYLILHGALDYWRRLKWLVDLSLLVRCISNGQKQEVFDLARHYDCQQAVIASLRFVDDYFPGSLDQHWDVLMERYEKPSTTQKIICKFDHLLHTGVGGDELKADLVPRFPVPASTIFEKRIDYGEIIFRRLAGAVVRRR